MNKRLLTRIQETWQKLQGDGKTVDSDRVRESLVNAHPEYSRLKHQAVRRLIVQVMSTPPPGENSNAEDKGGHANSDQDLKNKKKRKKLATPQVPEKDAEERLDDPDKLNGSLRKMYQQSTSVPEQSQAEQRSKKLAQQRTAMAAARREYGLPDPQKGTSFMPEERPSDRLEDLGGIDLILEDLRQLVVHPLTHPEVFTHLGVQPPTGVLLHGPPGSGKTKLANALAGTTGVSFFKLAATEIVSGMSGESEAKIRQLFQAAIAAAPSLLFLDEVDAITPKRDSAGREMERRIVAQLLTCLDELGGSPVVVLGCTNRPDALDPALRRAGRFDREIAMGIPDEPARARILERMASGMRLAEDLDLALLAKLTPGFVGADLSALTKEAALSAVGRAFKDLNLLRPNEGPENSDEKRPEPYSAEEMACLAVEMADFHVALTKVQPSARREGFTTIPDVTWDNVGALEKVRADMEAAICEPIRKVELFKEMGLSVPVGVLLFGPPGCGKTLLAKATANASGANFIAVKGPELLNKYVGESERAVRLLFQRASASAPCVIFFDELDALVPKRSAEGSTSTERVVNQMLTEMDGVNSRPQVYVIAATNRPDIVDPAMLRPGRLDRLLYVPLPSGAGRLEILKTHVRKFPLADDVDLNALARDTDGYSGADLAALTREAAMVAIRASDAPASGSGNVGEAGKTEIAREPVRITLNNFAEAHKHIKASVRPDELQEYEALAVRLCGSVQTEH